MNNDNNLVQPEGLKTISSSISGQNQGPVPVSQWAEQRQQAPELKTIEFEPEGPSKSR